MHQHERRLRPRFRLVDEVATGSSDAFDDGVDVVGGYLQGGDAGTLGQGRGSRFTTNRCRRDRRAGQ
jgi:hypothetical protein